jgi:hypothetical protein
VVGSELDRGWDLLHASWSLVEDEAERQPSRMARAALAGQKLCVVVKYNTGMNLCGELFSLLVPSKGEVVDA